MAKTLEYKWTITSLDVPGACRFILEAAANDVCLLDIQDRIWKMVAGDKSSDQFTGKIIRFELEHLS